MSGISLVIPVYNEEDTLPILHNRLKTVLGEMGGIAHEVIYVDDGSKDGTRLILDALTKNDSRTRAIFLSRNFGHQAAISAGLDHACGEVVLIMDADLQDPPELIPEMYRHYKNGHDVVYAIRRKRKEHIFKRLSYSLFYRMMHAGSGSAVLPRDSGDFALLSRRAVSHITTMPERNRYIRGIRSWIGFSQVGIEYERDERYAGDPKYSLIKLLKLAYDGIFSFTYLPLFIVNLLGVIFSFFAGIGIVAILILRFVTETYIPGFASTAILILFVGGIQLFMIGILGEYIRRIYDEVKQRPLYITEKKVNFDDNG